MIDGIKVTASYALSLHVHPPSQPIETHQAYVLRPRMAALLMLQKNRYAYVHDQGSGLSHNIPATCTQCFGDALRCVW